MIGFLETITGRYAGTTFSVDKGEVCQVGSKFGADIFLPNDLLLAPLHFLISNEKHIEIQDCTGKKETFVNNKPVEKAKLNHGDFISAGETVFQLTIYGQPTPEDSPLGNLISGLLQVQTLTLLIDENVDARISPIIHQSNAEFRILKEGLKNLEALTANPIVVEMPTRTLLERFIRTFWGQGRLIFFRRRFDLDETTKHLRFLLAKTQYKDGIDLRFYDPRMLRVVLSEEPKIHTYDFFYGVKRYFVESQLPSYLLEFKTKDSNIIAKNYRLTAEIKRIPTQEQIQKILEAKSLRGDFSKQAKFCLQKFLPKDDIDFDQLAEQSLPFFETYQIEKLSAKIQFVALSAIFEQDFVESDEVKNHFAFSDFTGDEKLGFLVQQLNQTRF